MAKERFKAKRNVNTPINHDASNAELALVNKLRETRGEDPLAFMQRKCLYCDKPFETYSKITRLCAVCTRRT